MGLPGIPAGMAWERPDAKVVCAFIKSLQYHKGSGGWPRRPAPLSPVRAAYTRKEFLALADWVLRAAAGTSVRLISCCLAARSCCSALNQYSWSRPCWLPSFSQSCHAKLAISSRLNADFCSDGVFIFYRVCF